MREGKEKESRDLIKTLGCSIEVEVGLNLLGRINFSLQADHRRDEEKMA